MAVRTFSASLSGAVSVKTDSRTSLFTAIDSSITDALAETTIDASVTAEAAVAAIQVAVDAAEADLNASIGQTGYPVTLVLDGTLTRTQIYNAVQKILRAIDSHPSEFE